MSRVKLRRLVNDGCTMNVVYEDDDGWESLLEGSGSPNDIYDAVNECEGSLVEVFKGTTHMGNIFIYDDGCTEEDIVDYHSNDYLNEMLGD